MHQIVFRTDATFHIGSGHFMRCFTMAKELSGRGARCIFITRDLPDYLGKVLVTNGFSHIGLPIHGDPNSTDGLMHSSWLGVSQFEDAIDVVKIMSGLTSHWLIVDHYALDFRWEEIVRGCTKKILVIDDIADRRHDCDLLLDQNLHIDSSYRYEDKVPPGCKLLLGPRYSLLRKEFGLMHKDAKPKIGSVRKVVIFFGGVDKDNFTQVAISALERIDNQDIEVDVVIGAQHPNIDEIEKLCQHLRYTFHIQTEHLAEIFARADLGIGAGGSSSWERCCVALPTLQVSLAENQIAISEALNQFGASLYLGKAEDIGVEKLSEGIKSIIEDELKRSKMSKIAYSLVDGLGVVRVCDEIMGFGK